MQLPATLARTAALALLLVAAAAPARAEEPVTVEAKLDAPAVAPGESALVRFKVAIPAHQHVYPPGATEGVPLEAKLEPAVPGVAPGALVPKVEPRVLDVPGVGKVSVLEGGFDVEWKLEVAKDAAPGPRELKGTFTYQACTDEVCFPPRDVPFALALEVTAAKAGTPEPEIPTGPPIQLPKAVPAHGSFALAPPRARPGDTVALELDVFLAKGFHVYAPDSQAGQPTKVEVALPPGLVLDGGVQAPPAHKTVDEFGETAKYYEGRVKLLQRVRVTPDAKPGKLPISAKATWLVCDEKGCRPGGEKGEVVLEVVAAETTATTTRATDPSTTPVASAATVTPEPPRPASDSLLASLVIPSILAGIVMLVMPCTYPMIPITISIFSKGKKLTRGQTAWRAAVYALGIVVSFTLVGGVIQAFLGNEGQETVRKIASNGPLNLAIAAAFVYFAVSFLGYYEVELPYFVRQWVQGRVDQVRKSSGEATGGVPLPALFLMGFFFVVTSYTCGAPIVLGVITAGAATPGKATIILATAIFGLTVAIPFFVLALVPGLLKSLPRSGGWFTTVKVVLGIVEIAAALKFLSNADLAWNLGLLTRPVFLASWVVAAVLTTLYVAGVIQFSSHHDDAPPDEPKAAGRLKAIVAAAPFVAVTLYLLSGMEEWKIPAKGEGLFARARYELAANLEAFLPPEPYPGREGSSKAKPEGILPFESFEKAKETARAARKLLFLEFTGHQCVNCRKMEKTVLVAPKVKEALARFQTAALFTDGTDARERDNLRVQTEVFKSPVIPAYYVVDPATGKILSEQVGATSEEEFLQFLARGKS